MKRRISLFIVVLFFLAGLGLTLYPLVSDWYMGRHQATVVAEYDEEAAHLSQKKIEDELEKAREYNEELLGNVVLTDPFDADALETQNKDYKKILNINGDGVLGSVEIPSIKVYLPVYHGTDAESLKKGTGHLQNTSFPVGGTGTHAVISGHTALPTAEMFNGLADLEEKDVFYIHVLKETLAYEIDQIKVVSPENTSDLLIDREKDYVTLVTCTPYGINSHRLLVRGVRIPYEENKEAPAKQAAVKNNKWRAYYIAGILAVILLAAGGLCIWLRKRAKRRKHHEE